MGKHTPERLLKTAAAVKTVTRKNGRYETKDAENLPPEIKEIIKAFTTKLDGVKEIATDLIGKQKAGEEVSEEIKNRADEAITSMNEMKTDLDDKFTKLEQAVAEMEKGGGVPDELKSIGLQVVEDERIIEFCKSGDRGKASFSMKANITSSTDDVAGAAGALVVADRQPGIIAPPQRTMTIRDLLTPGRTESNTIEYIKETGFTDNTGMVAEGALKPTSDLKFAEASATVRTIAHLMKASRIILDDASQLRSHIDGRLLYGLAFKEEGQLLNGDGTGQNLNGLITQATAYAVPGGLTVASAQVFDTCRLALLQASLAEYPATGVVLNPIDWARAELVKDSTGRYIVGQPQGTASPTMWSLPVVATQSIAQDKFLVGAFRLGAQIFDRWQSRIELATQNNDDFEKNMVTILAEQRLALAVYRPEAFVYGDLGYVA